jgi:hypothetical protein
MVPHSTITIALFKIVTLLMFGSSDPSIDSPTTCFPIRKPAAKQKGTAFAVPLLDNPVLIHVYSG